MINTKRILKHKKLLNALKDKFAHELKLNNVKLRIKNKLSKKFYDISYAHSEYNILTRHLYIKSLNFNLQGVKNRAKIGYTSSYYSGRPEKLSFVKGNRKLSRNFILCHELAHFHLIEKDLIKGTNGVYNTEKNADKIAIALLRKNNLLKGKIK